ncbi:glycoside hydrolase family 26 protein [uncultured Kordia sp.]|uniref:glycoside hydrolase family 26 protein n=1 Tax=uncultured Kordia sp. TaxID=507699 RepID=UPI002636924B|nr:glycosyl hydrolase [uncultured Kordia sp.]
MIKKNIFNYSKIFIIVLVALSFSSCTSLYDATYAKPQLVDQKLSKETKVLHKKLFMISKAGFAIGQQDATAYGIGWKKIGNANVWRSDMHDVSGNFPSIYGFDIAKIEFDSSKNIDSVDFNVMRNLIVEAHKKGGLITISWHAYNPVNDASSWDTIPAVSKIIKNGNLKPKYKAWGKKVADFLTSLEYKGRKIPVIFRPFHEMNGEWFWWGKGHCTPEEYQTLWRETVHMLRDEYKVHNLLYVYAPNRLKKNEDYLKYYPGDEYVDILGVDIYDYSRSDEYVVSLKNDLSLVKRVATEKNKLYALTETGLESVTTNNWFTETLYPNIKNSGISWILFWRNANRKHHYMPYKFHKNEDDFKKFQSLTETLFLKDLNNLKF